MTNAVDANRVAFEKWAKANRSDLDLRYMYDADGNYHHDGYIWAYTADVLRVWQASRKQALEEAERQCYKVAAEWDGDVNYRDAAFDCAKEIQGLLK